jgi:hypothetical protein
VRPRESNKLITLADGAHFTGPYSLTRRLNMPHSVIEAIKLGIWDYEPKNEPTEDFDSTIALPGSDEKLAVLARRLQMGEPLWHPQDRLSVGGDED